MDSIHQKTFGVCLVLFHSEKYISSLLDSLKKQTCQDFDLFVYDNGSSEAIAKVKEAFPQAKIYGQGLNTGFAYSNNVLISKSENPYIILINPDIILHPHCFEILKKVTQSSLSFGSLAPKLYKAEFGLLPDSIVKTKRFDSTGLQTQRNRHFSERDSNVKDIGQREKIQEVFGASGALVVYDRKALQAVSYKKEYLDESFFVYKEDIDLAWRLQNANYPCYYIPQAIAWHFRGVSASTHDSVIDVKEDRKTRSEKVKMLSYANHLSMIFKNERWGDMNFPFILWYELKKCVYLCLFERKTLHGFALFVKRLPELLKKRRYFLKLYARRPK